MSEQNDWFFEKWDHVPRHSLPVCVAVWSTLSLVLWGVIALAVWAGLHFSGLAF